jgi:hypothetical protein
MTETSACGTYQACTPGICNRGLQAFAALQTAVMDYELPKKILLDLKRCCHLRSPATTGRYDRPNLNRNGMEDNHDHQPPRRESPVPSRLTHRVQAWTWKAGEGQKARQRGGEAAEGVLASPVGSERSDDQAERAKATIRRGALLR